MPLSELRFVTDVHEDVALVIGFNQNIKLTRLEFCCFDFFAAARTGYQGKVPFFPDGNTFAENEDFRIAEWLDLFCNPLAFAALDSVAIKDQE
jgi:hypothetical protein